MSDTKTTVIYHRSDYDGIFCREIARKFLPDAEFIGWDYGDAVPNVATSTALQKYRLFMLDISIDPLMDHPDLIWIDHHKSAIAKYPDVCGYQIDGVAACRLAWQYFSQTSRNPKTFELPQLGDFKQRVVDEPLAVRLAGEYDIWDHRDNDADVAFQFGLDAQTEIPWGRLLDTSVPSSLAGTGMETTESELICPSIISDGRAAMRCYAKRDADTMLTRSFYANFEGITFLALNTARCNSNTFAAKDLEMEPQHDGLLAFYWTGKDWSVSLYHAAHRKDLDLSQIAVKFGGGGHRGACGFRAKTLPFITCS